MKKFLTVLLALSVVFTYTVGSAFASTGVDTPTDPSITDPVKAAVKELTDDMNDNVADAKKALKDSYIDTFTDAGGSYKLTITKAMYEKVLDQIAADYAEIVKRGGEAAIAESSTPSDLKTYIAEADTANYIIYNGAYLTVSAEDYPTDAAGLVDFITAQSVQSDLGDYYIVKSWEAAVKDAKAYLDGEFAKVDYSLYTTDIADKDAAFPQTWREMAQNAVGEYKEFVAEKIALINPETISRTNAVGTIYSAYSALNWLVPVKTVAGTDGTTLVVTYKLADTSIKTEEVLNGETADKDATQTALKAQVQANAAAALKDALKNPATYEANKALINAYTEVWNILIENDYDKVLTELNYNAVNGTIDPIPNNPTDQAYKDRTDQYDVAVKVASALKLEVEKDGTLKYAAAKVDENLSDLQVAIYWDKNFETNMTETALKIFLANDAKVKSDNLAWEKEVAIASLTAELEDVLDTAPGYFALEEAKIKAEYQKQIDKVNAAASSDQLAKIAVTIRNNANISSIDDKNDVRTALSSYPNTDKFLQGVTDQLVVLNFQLGALSDGYRAATTKTDVVEFLAENDARTNADVATLLNKVEAYAKALPTNAETEAANEAAKKAIEAIPTHVTLADKATIEAAWKAAKDTAYENNSTLQTAITLVMRLESLAIDDMIKALPATLTAADKAAVDAIFDAIEVYENEEMYGGDTYDNTADAVKAFEAVRAAALRDVENAIAAISANPTKAEVEAVRAAVDAFVAEYTDAAYPYQAIAKIVNLDKLTYAEAQVKANIIAATESLKISVSTKLYTKSNKIRVNWKVKEGDASAITGYQVYKSTKAHTEYKYMGKTTKSYMDNKKGLKKGKRFFYKVRAYVEIDGERYYSDWSNKGNRIYK